MMAMLTSSCSWLSVASSAERHLEAAVADDGPHLGLGPRDLRANRRRQREAHRPQPARGDERARLLVAVVLRFPHLVLADVGDDERVAGGRAPEIVHHVRGIEVAVVGQVLDVANGGVALRFVDPAPPGAAIAARDKLAAAPPSTSRQIGDDADIGRARSCRSRRRRCRCGFSCAPRRVGRQVAGDAIVEPHAKRDQQVGLLNRGVDPGLAVHAHHPEVERMRSGEAADAEQRHRHRNPGALGEAAQSAPPTRMRSPRGRRESAAAPRGRSAPPPRRAPRGRAPAWAARVESRARRPSQSNAVRPCCASLVMSISTGPGRPDRAT